MEIERMREAAVTYSRPTVEAPEVKTEFSGEAAAVVTTAELSKGKSTGKTGNSSETVEQGNLGGNNTQIKKAVEEINRKANNSEAIFGIHDATNRVTIKIVDKDSKEVIKEFPPEKTLDMIAKVWEVAGLLVDEKL